MPASLSCRASGDPRSATGHDYLQILARDYQRSGSGAIHLRQERREISLQSRRAAVGRKRCERLVDRPIPGAEHLDEMCRGAIAEIKDTRGKVDARGRVPEQLPQMRLDTPERRGLRTRRGRDVATEGLEESTDEAIRGPIGQSNPAARSAHSRAPRLPTCDRGRTSRRMSTARSRTPRSRRATLLHRRQEFGVQAVRPCPLRAPVEQRRHVVGRGHLHPAGRQRASRYRCRRPRRALFRRIEDRRLPRRVRRQAARWCPRRRNRRWPRQSVGGSSTRRDRWELRRS